jgi:hypothetical protein
MIVIVEACGTTNLMLCRRQTSGNHLEGPLDLCDNVSRNHFVEHVQFSA